MRHTPMAGSLAPACAEKASTLMARSMSPLQRSESGARPPSLVPPTSGWLALNARVMCAARLGEDHTCAHPLAALSATRTPGRPAQVLMCSACQGSKAHFPGPAAALEHPEQGCSHP